MCGLDSDGTLRMDNCTTGHYIYPKQGDLLDVMADDWAPRDGLVHMCLSMRRTPVLCGPEVRWQWRRWRSSHK